MKKISLLVMMLFLASGCMSLMTIQRNCGYTTIIGPAFVVNKLCIAEKYGNDVPDEYVALQVMSELDSHDQRFAYFMGLIGNKNISDRFILAMAHQGGYSSKELSVISQAFYTKRMISSVDQSPEIQL